MFGNGNVRDIDKHIIFKKQLFEYDGGPYKRMRQS